MSLELGKILDGFDLTEEQKNFLKEYAVTYNATRAYMNNFGKSTNRYTARLEAAIELRKPNVKKALEKLREAAELDCGVSTVTYLDTLVRAATADIGDYIKFSEEEIPLYDDVGLPLINQDTGEQMVKKVNKMHLVDSALVDTSIITEIKQGKDGVTIKLVDKLKAWEKIAEYLNWGSKQQDDVVSSAQKLIDALNKNVTNSWQKKDIDADLEKFENS